ncbi:hypothetical protein GON03_17740 [Nocardioides sp. MAH-18]|uniref:Poly-beta-1,6-N-acetyl-D-glucosamine biosynthesis protein PgaD n=1 Tax=Nocardioides agri TaxID=2682843 RepID=A0A6L6XV09_9ACTN|nr:MULTISPECIES: hypothetical protein [unclassified Nocardioides]MBA2956186.1 hypothetical protein [Nocardioides sp. CGMCC 1.13656]MVQ51030.1 hypothetical protein [Nocardioides sp. MAH-18]
MSDTPVSGGSDEQPQHHEAARVPTAPDYVVHHVDEKAVTVDWFFGDRRVGTKLTQLALVLIGWFFVILPVVITTSALVHRNDDDGGWWGYHEGFVMWEVTMLFLGILLVLFVVGFLALHLLDASGRRTREQTTTYDEERLALRLEVAGSWYADKFGPADLRKQQTRVHIEPYGDIETYELRGRYRSFGAE